MSRLVVVAGPTGTGKSDLAVELALRLDGEVVNADSMQLYRGMDIGTAKLPPDQRRGVPHHLLDVLDVTERASVAAYQREARAVIEQLIAAGRTPVLVGGSGLYIQSVIDEIAFPGTDPQLREHYLQRLEAEGPETLHAELDRVDPVAAQHILSSNGRRIVRALEVVALTGAPFSATMPVSGAARYGAVLLTLDLEPDTLDERLALRVHRMMDDGFSGEVEQLLGAGLREGVTASRALGYAPLIEALDGLCSLEDAVQRTISATRRFVRRQRSWFRRDGRRIDLDGARPDLAVAAVAAVTG
ncbi:tRNA (adenosine(37)-N6)-dimethylallyltransferase MiaA [Nakamurella sp. A5-74]|uniref:tRNA dimethylallyltransferase n=1 Tax=Nakamurella sp. A5-74 TaxID=3158264 RepID=A0AAU8DKF3_9ACTN